MYEVWADLEGYPFHIISQLGRVRDLKNKITYMPYFYGDDLVIEIRGDLHRVQDLIDEHFYIEE